MNPFAAALLALCYVTIGLYFSANDMHTHLAALMERDDPEAIPKHMSTYWIIITLSTLFWPVVCLLVAVGRIQGTAAGLKQYQQRREERTKN